MAERHRGVPLVDALLAAGAGCAALAHQTEALVAAEAQSAAQLGAGQAVHRAIEGVSGRAAVRRCGGKITCFVDGDMVMAIKEVDKNTFLFKL